jgi:hypothetical protein
MKSLVKMAAISTIVAAAGVANAGPQVFLGTGNTGMASARTSFNGATTGRFDHNFDAPSLIGIYGSDTSSTTRQSPSVNNSTIAYWNQNPYAYVAPSFSFGSAGVDRVTYSSGSSVSQSVANRPDLYVINHTNAQTAASNVTSGQGNFLGIYGENSGIQIDLDPGQSAFGFEFYDQELTDIQVTWNDGTVNNFPILDPPGGILPGTDQKGFFGVARWNFFITSITIRSANAAAGSQNEGIAFDNFVYGTAIPLPTGAAMGMAGLGLLAIRRRSAR